MPMPVRRRRWGTDSSSHSFFGSVGWLFADLMLALAVAFLVATTVGEPPPPRPDPTPTTTRTPAPSPTPTPTPTTTRPAEPALDLRPIRIVLRVDRDALLSDDPRAIASVRRQLRDDRRLSGRHAGLVLLFGGNQNLPAGQGTRVAEKVANAVMKDLGRQGFVFRNTVYRPFFDLSEPASQVQADIYVFKRNPR